MYYVIEGDIEKAEDKLRTMDPPVTTQQVTFSETPINSEDREGNRRYGQARVPHDIHGKSFRYYEMVHRRISEFIHHNPKF